MKNEYEKSSRTRVGRRPSSRKMTRFHAHNVHTLCYRFLLSPANRRLKSRKLVWKLISEKFDTNTKQDDELKKRNGKSNGTGIKQQALISSGALRSGHVGTTLIVNGIGKPFAEFGFGRKDRTSTRIQYKYARWNGYEAGTWKSKENPAKLTTLHRSCLADYRFYFTPGSIIISLLSIRR